jgi:hypothetical protein
MLKSGKLIENIIQNLTIFKIEIQSNSKLGLNNQHIHAENFLKNILNIIFDWKLESLNSDTSNFPGLDLGDSENSVAFQITGDNSSHKINKTLDSIKKEKHYLKYKKIYVFVLSKKQKKYTLSQGYKTEFQFDEKTDIIDFDFLFQKIKDLDIPKLEKLDNLISKEFPYLNQYSKQSEDSYLAQLTVKIEDHFKIDLDDDEIEIYLMEVFQELKNKNLNFHNIVVVEENYFIEKIEELRSYERTIAVRKEIVEIKKILDQISELKHEINEKLKIFYYTHKYPITDDYKKLTIAFREIVENLTYPSLLIEETDFLVYFRKPTKVEAAKFKGGLKFDIYKDHQTGKRLGCSIWLTKQEILDIKSKLWGFRNLKEDDFFNNYLLMFQFEEMDFSEQIITTKVIPSFVDRFFDYRTENYNYIQNEDYESWVDLTNYLVGLG